VYRALAMFRVMLDVPRRCVLGTCDVQVAQLSLGPYRGIRKVVFSSHRVPDQIGAADRCGHVVSLHLTVCTAQPWPLLWHQNRLLFKSQSSRPDRARRQMWPCSFSPLDSLHSSALAPTLASEQAAFQVTEFPTG